MEATLVNYEGRVVTITINRSEALNALSTQVLMELNQALDETTANNGVYALILTRAEEKPFVVGADVAEMKDGSVGETAAYGRFSSEVFRKIETSRCPIVAAANGFTLSGGCELVMSYDIRVASEDAVFGQPEVGLGIILGFGGAQRLARPVGTDITKEMIYTARNIKAERTYAIDLINNAIPAEELMAIAMKMANDIAKNTPIAVAYSEKAISNELQTDIDGGIAIEMEEFSDCFATEDQTYGITCFLEKTRDKKFSNK